MTEGMGMKRLDQKRKKKKKINIYFIVTNITLLLRGINEYDWLK